MLDTGLSVIMIVIIITITMTVIKATELQIFPSARTANVGKNHRGRQKPAVLPSW